MLIKLPLVEKVYRVLLKYSMLLSKFYILENREKVLIIKVFIIMGLSRFAMLWIPFKKLKRYMGEYNKESDWTIESSKYAKVKKIESAIRKVSMNTPWESKCLVQALTAQRLLSKENITSTLYLGVNKVGEEKLNAHAWIRCGGIYVTGGNGENFAKVARFTR